MPVIEIDGKQIEIAAGATVMDAAHQAGTHGPQHGQQKAVVHTAIGARQQQRIKRWSVRCWQTIVNKAFTARQCRGERQVLVRVVERFVQPGQAQRQSGQKGQGGQENE